MGKIQYEVNEEPIVLSKHLIDLLLSQPDCGDLIALYCFYYYTAKWQKTNQPKATNHYVQTGLNWGEQKVKKYKRQLIDLHLIENIVIKDHSGQIVGSCTKVNFIWSKEKVNIMHKEPQILEKKTIGVVFHQMENQPPNALITNNKRDFSCINIYPKKWQENEEFQKTLEAFIADRKERRKSLTTRAQEMLKNNLTKFDISIGIKALNNSIENGWTSVYPENVLQRTNNTPKFKASQFKPPYKLDGTIRYYLNENDGEYYHKTSGEKYID